MIKKILFCAMLAGYGFANPIGTVLKEGAEQAGKLLKKFGDDALLLGQKAYKTLGTNAVEKKILKSATFVKQGGVIVAKRSFIFRPTKENLARMRQGRAPVGIDGQPLDLHHLKQDKDGILVEMTHTEHRGKHYDDLHKCKPGMQCTTDVEHGNDWNALRQRYWRARAKDFDKAS